MRSSRVYIHHVGVVEGVLGPGRRVAVWLSGCPHRCPGCIEKRLRDIRAGSSLPVEEVCRLLEAPLAELGAVTFSGGEPLFQARPLARLVDLLPAGTDRMLFTGYLFRELDPVQRKLFRKMDLCVCGRYIRRLGGSHLWRGSSNQVMISPSGRYGPETIARWMAAPSAGLQWHFRGESSVLYGIPVPGALARIRRGLADGSVSVSEGGE